MGKALKGHAYDMTAKEFSLVIEIANTMDRYNREYDFDKSVKKELKNLKKKYSGVVLFFIGNILNFDPTAFYKPGDIKKRFENHMGWNLDTADTKTPAGKKSVDSRDVNKALKMLKRRIGLKYANIGKKKIKELKRTQDIEFGGFPSVIKPPKEIALVKKILSKPKVFYLFYEGLLESRLLDCFWRFQFMTILGCLEQLGDEWFDQVAENLYAAIPEKQLQKLDVKTYVHRLASLHKHLKTLNDIQFVETADKMAEYIIKSVPAFSIFATHIQ